MADCCIIVPEFSRLRLEDLRRARRTTAVVDGRRVLEPKLFIGKCIKSRAVGQGPEPVARRRLRGGIHAG